MLRDGNRYAIDGYYVACEEAWNAVWSCPGDRGLLAEAATLHADALAGFLESACRQGRFTPQGIWIGSKTKPILVPIRPEALPVAAGGIASVAPQNQPQDRRITRRHVRDGFGLPVVVRLAETDRRFAAERTSLAATAVLRFSMPGGENVLEKFAGPVARDHAAAVLDLANPVEIAAVQIGPARPHLAADLTAPLLDLLAAKPKQSALLGFVQPFGNGSTQPHLEILEPHQPGRVPVVFIHGLASDEGTWFDMLNELRAWPVFHRRFEAWLYHYPTGASFMQSAAVLRGELAAAIRTLDPEGRDPALRKMVLVGHSMGGLHAKLQVVSAGNDVWNGIATKPFDQVVLPAQMKAIVRNRYFFEPQPYVNRVVFIATPHRGSILASLGVGRLASLTVSQPAEIREIHDTALRLNPGMFKPEYAKSVPTTIDLLEPSSELLQTIEKLRPPCWVTTHSIVGTGHHSLTGGYDDGVVSAASAHTTGAVSEVTVPATHTKVHHHPRAIVEVERILLQHLHENGLVGPGGPAAPPPTP